MSSDKKTTFQRITGNHLFRFKIEQAISDSELASLFGVSQDKMKKMLAEPKKGIDDPVVCYLYRQYDEYPELLESNVDIQKFYELIGGLNVISGADFSLTIGRELSAYTRYFSGGKPTPSLKAMIRNAIKIHNGDIAKAFKYIQDLCAVEGKSRGISPLDIRTWHPKQG